MTRAATTPTPTPVDDDTLYEIIDGPIIKPWLDARDSYLVAALIGLLHGPKGVKEFGLVVVEMLFT